MKPRWQLEHDHLITPTGRRIPLDIIEDWAMAAWGGHQRIVTPKWTGWRVVQQFLVPPGRTVRTCPIHINYLRGLAHDIQFGVNTTPEEQVWRNEVPA